MSRKSEAPVQHPNTRKDDYINRLHRAYAIGTDLSTVHDLDMLIELSVTRIRKDLDYQYVSLFTLVKDELVLLGSSHQNNRFVMGSDLKDDFKSLKTIKIGNHIIGHAAKTGMPVLVPDISIDPRYKVWNQIDPALQPMQFELAIPLKTGDQVIGVLNIESTLSHDFTDDDQQILGLLTGQIAVALENIRLHKKSQEHIQSLDALNKIMESEIAERKVVEDALRKSEHQFKSLLDESQRQAQELKLLDRVQTILMRELGLDQVFQQVTATISDIFPNTRVAIYLEEEGALKLQSYSNFETPVSCIFLHVGVNGRVFRTGQPALVKDVTTDPDFFTLIDPSISEVCVPLKNESKIVGTINVESINTRMSELDLRLMISISEQINIAIERSALYANLHQSEERLRLALEAGQMGTWDYNVTNNFANRDEKYCQIFGLPPQSADGGIESFIQRVHPDDQDRIQQLTDQMANGADFSTEYRILRPDGSVRWILGRGHSYRNSEEDVYRTIGLVQDITDQKEEEERITNDSFSRLPISHLWSFMSMIVDKNRRST
jgi:PAS domain S-box-containing protein